MRSADIPILRRLRFAYPDTVRRAMRFEHHLRPCYYTEDIETWSTPWDHGYYSYLFEAVGNELRSPPRGMRSAVPLGGLGAGTVELRADGGLRDWTVFNNSPAGGGGKVQLEESFFALKVVGQAGAAYARALRTHPPRSVPGVKEIEYSGCYPASRLVIRDPDAPVRLTLYATSELHLRSPEASATPAALFTFVLGNPTASSVETSLLFVLPNHVSGSQEYGELLAIRRDGTDALSGSMAVGAFGDGVKNAAAGSDSLFRLWEEFVTGGLEGALPALAFGSSGAAAPATAAAPASGGPSLRYGALSASTMVPARGEAAVSFVLAWHFPNRPFSGKTVGNFYATLYRDAPDVVRRVSQRLTEAWVAAGEWHSLCFDTTLPVWLQDALANSLATMAKTGLWAHDGRWRQWESFSCPSLDPIHIHFYRVLPYAWFFPGLRRSQMRGFASAQRADGYIQENLGGVGTDIDHGGGRMMGDGPTVFVLEAYQDYLWSNDRGFLDEMWPSVQRALRWQIERSRNHGLPEHLENTYDWWEFDKKELVSYNAVLHVVALLAGGRLAGIQRDSELEALCRERTTAARRALAERLWTGEFYRSWWTASGTHPEALHADTLYGQLWAWILGLGDALDPETMRRHLRAEKRINGSRFGLKVMRGTGNDDDRFVPRGSADGKAATGFAPGKGGPVNDLVWETGSIDWTTLSILLGGDPADCLEEAERIFRKWREDLKDPWDIRDLTTGWDGFPWCNSHYARQLMVWAVPLALSGQQLDATAGRLSFEPRVSSPARLPFFTPSAHGTLDLLPDDSLELRVTGGELQVREITVRGRRAALTGPLGSGASIRLS